MEGQQMPPQSTPPAAPHALLTEEQVMKNNRAWACVGYLGLFSLLPLFMKKDNKFVQFHAKQGLVLYIAYFILSMFDMSVLTFLFRSILVIIYLIAIIKVWQNKYWKIPVIGDLAEKINI